MITLKAIISSTNKFLDNAEVWQRYLAGVLFILIGAALRIWQLGALEAGIAWLTFYPMVMIAALFGGFSVGVFSTFLTCIILTYFWQVLSPIQNGWVLNYSTTVTLMVLLERSTN